MTTTLQKQVLIGARALIADRVHWTRGTLACSAEGVRVPWHDPSASRWCVQGAIYRAAYNLVDDIAQAMHIGTELIRSMSPTGGSSLLIGYLPQVNDRQGHAAVLAAIDKALVVP